MRSADAEWTATFTPSPESETPKGSGSPWLGRPAPAKPSPGRPCPGMRVMSAARLRPCSRALGQQVAIELGVASCGARPRHVDAHSILLHAAPHRLVGPEPGRA